MKITYRPEIIGLALAFFCCASCSSEIPEEYFARNAQSALSDLSQVMYGTSYGVSAFTSKNGDERFKIVHISDIHLPRKSVQEDNICLKNLEEAIRFANMGECKINAIAATGDFVETTEKTNRETILNNLALFRSVFFDSSNAIPSFLCTGNHDTNMLLPDSTYYLSKEDVHQCLFPNPYGGCRQPGRENYYYADVKAPDGNIVRFIALDNTDQEGFDYNTLNVDCITQEQADWLIHTALQEGMTDKHSVVILTHHPLQEYSRNQETYMCSGIHLYKADLLPSIIDAYQQRKAISKTYKSNRRPARTININGDFTRAKGEFVCYLGGHAHTFGHFDVGMEGGPKQVMLLANTLSPGLQNNNYGYIDRSVDRNKYNSFSVYCIDTAEKKIYITYFGAAKSASEHIETVSYK